MYGFIPVWPEYEPFRRRTGAWRMAGSGGRDRSLGAGARERALARGTDEECDPCMHQQPNFRSR